MFKFLILTSLFLCLGKLSAQTNVSGGIYQNATWSLAASPYIVNGPVVVFPGVTLNIQPGVEIRINNLTTNNIYIETRGTINCVGTDAQPIKIRAMYDTTSTFAWQGFVCTSSQGGVLNADRFDIANAFFPFAYETPLNMYQYTNCKFRHCHQAVTVANEVLLNSCQFINNEVGVYGWSNFEIDNCLFKDNTTALYVWATALSMTNSNLMDNQVGLSFNSSALGSVSISDCQFSNNLLALNYPNNGLVENCIFNNNGTGIQSANDCEIRNNEFFDNELAIQASVDAEIHDNLINNNLGGIVIEYVTSVQDSPEIYDNEICSNINFAVNNSTNMNYSLLSNCFCDLDSAGIEAMIIDGYDDIIKGLINYQIYDSSCTNLLGTVIKYGAGAAINEYALDFKFENPVANGLLVFTDATIEAIEIQDLCGKVYYFSGAGSGKFDIAILPAGFYILSSVNGISIKKGLVKG